MDSGADTDQITSPELLVICYLLFIYDTLPFFPRCYDVTSLKFPSREELGQRSLGTEIYQGGGAGMCWAAGSPSLTVLPG